MEERKKRRITRWKEERLSVIIINFRIFSSFSIGRYLTFFICILLEVSVGIAVAFSPNFVTYTVLRFMLAMCNIGLFLMAFVVGR